MCRNDGKRRRSRGRTQANIIGVIRCTRIHLEISFPIAAARLPAVLGVLHFQEGMENIVVRSYTRVGRWHNEYSDGN